MIDILKYEDLLDSRIKVTCTDGQVFVGTWIDWTSAQDNDPDPESITLELDDSAPIELYVSEIKQIQKAHS